jgi:hypothetical protein
MRKFVAALPSCSTPPSGDESGVDAADTLQNIAQIGVSLVGFAGIVGALAGEKLRPSHSEIWLPFWVMISSGLGTLFVALFPLLPHYLGAPDHATWAASSAFLTVVTAINLVFFMPRIWRAQSDGHLAKMRMFDVPLNLISAAILISQVLNALGIGLSQSAGGFLVGLYCLLLTSGLNFVFLLYVMGRSHHGPPAA